MGELGFGDMSLTMHSFDSYCWGKVDIDWGAAAISMTDNFEAATRLNGSRCHARSELKGRAAELSVRRDVRGYPLFAFKDYSSSDKVATEMDHNGEAFHLRHRILNQRMA